MKQLLPTLLLLTGLCSVTFVIANDSDDDDSAFGNYEFSEVSEDVGYQCIAQMQQCANLVEEYTASGVYETAESIRQAGLRGVCKDVTELSECVLKVFLSEECSEEIPPPYKQMFQKGHDLTNYICVDRINDIETHWQCLMNTEVDENLEECQNVDVESLQVCDTTGIMSCVRKAFGASSECQPGAADLVGDVIRKAVEIIPHCSDRKKLHRAVLKLLKRK